MFLPSLKDIGSAHAKEAYEASLVLNSAMFGKPLGAVLWISRKLGEILEVVQFSFFIL